MADTSYVIKPQPPVRAFAIAAVLSLLGAALIVAALTLAWHWIAIVGGAVVLAAGLVLMAAGLLSMRAREVTLRLSDDGYELAAYDLSLRREGDILGNRQHGGNVVLHIRNFHVADSAAW